MRLTYLLLLVGIALVFYLSWVPDPNLKFVWFIPGWLARWTDSRANGDLRTAVPFVFLGVCIGLLVARRQQVWFWWFLAWLGLVGIVLIAEVGQLVLPQRSFRWADVGWGGAGALLGLLIALIGITAGNRLKKVSAK